MRKILLIFSIFTFAQSCSQNTSITLNELEFESIFGKSNKDYSEIYCLLGNGFFRAPSSENSDKLIADWILMNKDAKVILVSTLIDDKINYCWLVDRNGHSINEYLIRNGCFPGRTMMRPLTFEEMSSKEQELYDEEKPNIVIRIDAKSYDSFLDKIKLAEKFAQENKLGIWENQ